MSLHVDTRLCNVGSNAVDDGGSADDDVTFTVER